MRRHAFVVVATLFMAACSVMSGLRVVEDDTTATDGGKTNKKSDASSSGATTLPDGAPVCVLKHPPEKPTNVPAGGTDTKLTLALSSFDADSPPAPRGYDIDGFCTCGPGPAQDLTSEVRYASSCTFPSSASNCDYNAGGVDNAGANAFKAIVSAQFNPLLNHNNNINQGTAGNIFVIDGYNGQSNDDQITVTAYVSLGTGDPANFTDVQTWPVYKNSVVSTEAWVTDNVLVAHFATMQVPFLTESLKPATLIAPTLTATLTGTPPKIDLALIVGRAGANDMIQSFGELSAFGGFVCQSPFFPGLASSLCPAVDLATSPDLDGQGQKCDSLSLALQFHLVPAKLGEGQEPPDPSSGCGGQTVVTCH